MFRLKSFISFYKLLPLRLYSLPSSSFARKTKPSSSTSSSSLDSTATSSSDPSPSPSSSSFPSPLPSASSSPSYSSSSSSSSSSPPPPSSTPPSFESVAEDIQIPDSEIFTDREQRLSFQLLTAKSAEAVLVLFTTESSSQNTPLTPTELALFFYFVCSFRENLLHQPSFSLLLSLLLPTLPLLPPLYLTNVLWALGICKSEWGFEFDKMTYENIKKAVKEKEEEFEIQQLSGVAFAVGRIWEEGEEGRKEVAEVVGRMAERTVKNVSTITKADVFNFLMLFLSLNINSTIVLKSYALVISNCTLNPEEVEKAISLFSELNYQEKPFYHQMVQKLFKFPEISLETAVNSIFSLSKAMPEDINSLRGLLKVFHSNFNKINITGYVNLWLSLSKYRISTNEFSKTFEFLKKALIESKVFQLTDFEGYELVNIIIAMASLKIDDKAFLGLLIEALNLKLNSLDKSDLINIARAGIVYIRQFEDFFRIVHERCAEKYGEFNKEEKKMLGDTFERVKLLFPGSPFIKSKLY